MTPPSTFEDDFRWQERFRGHFSEIVRLASRVEVAAREDDCSETLTSSSR